MSKFKIGDKVVLVKESYHRAEEGKTYEVVGFGRGEGLLLKGLGDFSYDEEYFKLVEEKDMNKQFTKDMLVAGKHVVEYRDGSRRLVVETREGLGFIAATKFMESCHYEQDLSNVEFDDWDIVKVYEMFNLFSLRSIFEDSNLNLIWQREEKSQQEVEYEKLMEQISELQKQAEKLKP